MKTLLIAIAVSALGRFFADEAKEWLAWLPPKLIRWAVSHFPAECRDRLEEEWLAHANDLPGNLAKIFHALGCAVTAIKVGGFVRQQVRQVNVRACMVLGEIVEFLLVIATAVAMDVGARKTVRRDLLEQTWGERSVLGLNTFTHQPLRPLVDGGCIVMPKIYWVSLWGATQLSGIMEWLAEKS